MANRQVARVDDSWYGGGYVTDDDKDHVVNKKDGSRMSSISPTPNPNHDVQKTKRFALPMEPTESLDKTRDYPPIITVDGRVDTDIDHLMENADEDAGDSPVQDIPNKFPKPHVVRVIDGSLDDDIDNLINHDGTMAHTLVDAPKNFSGRELKEINSSKSPPPPPQSIPSSKKDNSITGRQSSASRVLSRMNRDDEDNGMSAGTGSKIVPYYERNNSSKAPAINSDDADFCHLKESLEEGFISPPPDLDKVTVLFAADKSEYLPVFDRVKDVDDHSKATQDEQEHVKSEKSKDEICNEHVEKSVKSEDVSEAENASDIDKGEATEAGEASDQSPSNSVSVVVEQLLRTMSKEELEKRLGIGCDSATGSEGEGEVLVLSAMESKQELTENKDEARNESVEPKKVDKEGSQQSVALDYQKANNIGELITTPKATDSQNAPSLQETMSLLKQSLDMLSKDTSETSDATESQKILAVTALKVAGESMAAAAKMADALTLLLQTSQASNTLFRTHSTSFHQAEKKEDATVATSSEPGMKGKHNEERDDVQSNKSTEYKIYKSPKSESRPQCPVETETESLTLIEDKEKVEVEEGKKRKSNCNSVEEKSRSHKEKREHESKGNDGRSSKKHREHDDRSSREAESKSKSESRKSYTDRKRRESKQSDGKDDHYRKRSSRKNEDVSMMDDEITTREEHFQGNQIPYHHREEEDKKMWEYGRAKQRNREVLDEYGCEFYGDNWESEYSKDRGPHESDGVKKRDKKRSSRDEQHKKNRSSPQHRSKSTAEMPPYKVGQDINESHSPKVYPHESNTTRKSLRGSRESRGDDYGSRRSSSNKPSDGSQIEHEVFVRSDPWTLPTGEQTESYFDQVVRQLKPFSPTRGSVCPPDPHKEYIRAKLVGSCVDPNTRDSDFDSIEFNANARPSESTRVHFDDEDVWHYCEGIEGRD